MHKNKSSRFLIKLLLILLILMNGIAFMHAYKFTHFSTSALTKTAGSRLTTTDKVRVLFTGIDQPKPRNGQLPSSPFETIELKSNKKIQCWLIRTGAAKGTIILFHGYGGEKSSMLDKAEVFLNMGYNTLLVDFMGAGGSEGTQTTIGYKEAEEVRTCYEFLRSQGESNIHLFGTSMGAVAIMRAISEYQLQPASIMIECPFGSMYKTVVARFRMFGVPAFPMAGLLLFWGSVQNGFWAFAHNPATYAQEIKCPTLLLYGEQDPKVNREEIDEIYGNLKGKKQLVTYPLAGHENYLLQYEAEWKRDISSFLKALE